MGQASMVLIQLYVIFAISTAITTWWGFFRPLISEAKSKGISNTMVDSPVLSGCVFIGVTTVLAPFVVSALLFPLHGEYFKVGLQRVIEESDD